MIKTLEGEVLAKEVARLTARTIVLASLNPAYEPRTIELASLNPAYEPRTVDRTHIAWIARIIWASQ